MKYPLSFNSTKYPDFIRKSIFLKAFPKPVKFFPRIGLKNCKVPVKSIKLSGKELHRTKLSNFKEAIDNLSGQINNLTRKRNKNEAKLYDLENDLSELVESLWDVLDGGYCNNDPLDGWLNDKNELVCPQSVRLANISLPKKGDRSFIKLIDEICQFVKNNKLPLDISLFSLEKLSTIELKNKPYYVCFSSYAEKGYWDIATMSMRGISSCMRWNSDHCKSLIGSIIDPYTAVIYLTNNDKTEYGEKMLARAVVRFVVSSNKKPAILIEEIYYNNSKIFFDKDEVKIIFESFINQNINKKIPVLSFQDDDDIGCDYYIPKSETVESIIEASGADCYYEDDIHLLSYRDSGISYHDYKEFYNPLKVSLNKKSSKKKSKRK